MSGSEVSVLAEARRHHRENVNAVLRRPGMYSRDETAEWLLFGAMAAVDGSTTRWEAERDRLRDDFFSPTGVMGAYGNLLPVNALRDATASIYAAIAHRFGWLDLDRTLPAAAYRRMAADVGEWATKDRTLSQVIDRFGTPSLRVGGNNPLWPTTLCYATADPDDDLICFHLWNTFADTDARRSEGVHPEPVVLAVRQRSDGLPFSFSFTPEGLRRRPAADRPGPPHPTVWIFHGDEARYASAVFETEEDGRAWAAGHRVTGILAEYPYGGAYDTAVSEGRFTPSKPHHGSANHVAGFTPGLRHVHLVDGRRD
jgi:hypothetical protein